MVLGVVGTLGQREQSSSPQQLGGTLWGGGGGSGGDHRALSSTRLSDGRLIHRADGSYG